jgi:glutathione-dependent peroxiredoxin
MNKELVGKSVPEVTFKVFDGSEWEDITTDDLFFGKKVIVFSLPGAFTPTCSKSHVPGYNELADTFKKLGIDDIICMSVNDTFVMNAWQKDQKADKLTFIPDGNGEFTEKMGLLVDKTHVGFGKRSWRYSMLVNNKIIEKIFVEPDKPGDPFEVSDADTMLWALDPDAKKPDYITMFTRSGCSLCIQAKELLDKKNIPYETIEVNDKVTSRSIKAVTGKTATPQVFIGGKHIGGLEQLKMYVEKNY